METPDHYGILGVGPDADGQAIEQGYRRQAQHWHPDRHAGSPVAHLRFLAIQRARQVLADPVARAAYDASRGPFVPMDPPAPRKAPAMPVFRVVPLELLLRGGWIDARAAVGVPCPRCAAGCRDCGFSGQVLAWRRWVVQVPPGHPPSRWLRFPDAGHSGPFFPAPGDVWLGLIPRKAHGWAWDWPVARLRRRLRVPVCVLATGAVLELRLPGGGWGAVVVPPRTRPGAWLELPSLVLGAPAQVQVRVGPWFSRGSRRARAPGLR